MKDIITIDGPSVAGKSTIAKLLAQKLGYSYLDTGAPYRAVAWKIREEKVDPENEKELNAGNYEGKTKTIYRVVKQGASTTSPTVQNPKT
jgi:cytidylate kinase